VSNPAISIRSAEPEDLPDALGVAARALGWDPSDPNEAFFRWKHLENPAGESPMWVAIDGDSVCGFRTMLRWRFTDGSNVCSAVRAVDTATDPNHRRRGIFKKLTLAAVDQLTSAGVEFIFNTPNDKSRPGYLSMGWSDAGKLPVRVSLAGPLSIPRLAKARVAAHKWSEPITVGDPIEACIADISDLRRSLSPVAGLTTFASPDHLLWRYGFGPLHYRVIRSDEAAAIIRVRQRGSAREAVLGEVFSPTPRATSRLLRQVRRSVATDYVITLGSAPHPTRWIPAIPGLGPHLTLRGLAGAPPEPSMIRFSMGDIELF